MINPFDSPRAMSARILSTAHVVKRRLLTTISSGTNGWVSSWGTNAHGEIAGCPPSPA